MLAVRALARQRRQIRPRAAARRSWLSSEAATAQDVVLLGHPALRAVCTPCGTDDLSAEKNALVATLQAFRDANGFGRGIAAPQIGVTRRFIAVNMGADHPIVTGPPRVLSDPEVTWRSPETFTLFDDCMSRETASNPPRYLISRDISERRRAFSFSAMDTLRRPTAREHLCFVHKRGRRARDLGSGGQTALRVTFTSSFD